MNLQNAVGNLQKKYTMSECWKGVRLKVTPDERRQRSEKKKSKSRKKKSKRRFASQRIRATDISLSSIATTQKEAINNEEDAITVQSAEQQTLKITAVSPRNRKNRVSPKNRKIKITAVSPRNSPRPQPSTPRLCATSEKTSPTTVTASSKKAFASAHETVQSDSRTPRLSLAATAAKKTIASCQNTCSRGAIQVGTPRLSPSAPRKAFVNSNPNQKKAFVSSHDILQLDSIQTKLPCVAAAAAENIPSPKASKRRKKRVRFAADAKDWDGMRPESAILQRVVLEFWQATPAISTLKSLHDSSGEHELRRLYNLLDAVIQRVEQYPNQSSPLLPQGGGQGIKFNGQHLQKMKALLTVVSCVHTKVVKSITHQIQCHKDA